MSKKLTRAGLEAALKRAGKVATSGPRSSRAGRVIPAGPPKRLPNAYVVEHVSSTAIERIGYDSDRRELRIAFKSGRTYVYDDVPIDTYEELLSAESQGAYFNHNIRDAYEYREVR
ncbi:MAG TPA: KTSC domain-containing protein [Vitreimonas sp.]|uniref:KTSC domain-containing protein n=1 Tax=Vitreimonas sp. TaxID=3069702 RepID=UPI002D4B1BF1|nr:KTSC domain-containing protein [Vitreimonas sp.]HYD89802.1 KTSC domain-containing protein [Vitreimonas sp.]